jgi:hypothetical protein
MVSWMRRNEYISTENTRFMPKHYESVEAKYENCAYKNHNNLHYFKLKLDFKGGLYDEKQAR